MEKSVSYIAGFDKYDLSLSDTDMSLSDTDLSLADIAAPSRMSQIHKNCYEWGPRGSV